MKGAAAMVPEEHQGIDVLVRVAAESEGRITSHGLSCPLPCPREELAVAIGRGFPCRVRDHLPRALAADDAVQYGCLVTGDPIEVFPRRDRPWTGERQRILLCNDV